MSNWTNIKVTAVAIVAAVIASVATGVILKPTAIPTDNIAPAEAVAMQQKDEEIAGLAKEVNILSNESDQQKDVIANLKQQVTQLEAKNATTPGQIDIAMESFPTDTFEEPVKDEESDEQEPEESVEEHPGKAFAKMFDNPQMMKMLETQARNSLSIIYGKLFGRLNLTDEEKAKVEDILVEAQMAQTKMGFKMFKQEVTREMLDDIQIETDTHKEQKNALLKEVLGENRFETFDSYTEMIDEHLYLNMLTDELTGTANPIQDYQEEQVIQAIREEREAHEFGSNFTEESYKLLLADKPEMDAYFDNLKKLDDTILLRLENILNPAQIDSYRVLRIKRLEAVEAQIAMSRNMIQLAPDVNNQE